MLSLEVCQDLYSHCMYLYCSDFKSRLQWGKEEQLILSHDLLPDFTHAARSTGLVYVESISICGTICVQINPHIELLFHQVVMHLFLSVL